MHENLELRPKNFQEFIGQNKIKKTLFAMIQSAKKRKTKIDHIIFNAAPGFGKTTLANLIAQESGLNIKFIQGPSIEKKADLLQIFAALKEYDLLFIDEIHAINKNVEELLYSAMEEGVVDIPFGVEGDSKIIRMKLPKFTIIGATTKIYKISKPLRDRFGFIANFEMYNLFDIIEIIKSSSKKLNILILESFYTTIAEAAQLVPRQVNNILKRIRDFMIFHNTKQINQAILEETLSSIGIYAQGLNQQQISYLKILASHFQQKWISLETISSMLMFKKEVIQTFIEPELLKLGFLEKSFRGRMITEKALEYLNNINFLE
ncbi:Holliday junction branch migration DNA helicase RuvB [Candidatus Mycoplasma pogonae]